MITFRWLKLPKERGFFIAEPIYLGSKEPVTINELVDVIEANAKSISEKKYYRFIT